MSDLDRVLKTSLDYLKQQIPIFPSLYPRRRASDNGWFHQQFDAETLHISLSCAAATFRFNCN